MNQSRRQTNVHFLQIEFDQTKNNRDYRLYDGFYRPHGNTQANEYFNRVQNNRKYGYNTQLYFNNQPPTL